MGGHDIIEGGAGNDVIVGDYNSAIAGLQYGDDFLSGGAGDDAIAGNAGNDYLDGGTGNDGLLGGDGNDTLRGNAGNDVLDGGAGNDTYIIDANWGTDLIRSMNNGNETIKFSAGINPSTLNVIVDTSGRLVIRDPSTSSVLMLEDFFSNTSSTHRLEFANGTVWTMADLQARFKPTDGSFNGGAASDTIVGDSANNTINGNHGSDTLLGGSGDDTIFGGVDDDGYTYGATDDDALFGGEGNDRIDGEYGNDLLDGGAGNDTLNGGSGIDTLRGGAGNDVLDASWWRLVGGQAYFDTENNYLDGGSGDDKLTGGLGRNTYSFAEGFGNDKVYLTQAGELQASLGASSEAAVLSFAAGIAASELTFTRNGNDLIIAHGQDRITVIGYATRGSATVELTFSDGSVLSSTQQNFLSSWQGTAAPETLSGTSGNDILNGFSGDDIIYGNAGNDTITGGVGSDRLYGGKGDDTYRYDLNSGVDFIWGDKTGSDVLVLGAGIARSDVSFYTNGTGALAGLYVVINSTGNYISTNWDTTTTATDQTIDLIRFSDGTTLTASEIQALSTPMTLELSLSNNVTGTTLFGNQYANSLGAGWNVRDATIAGGAGDDTYFIYNYDITIIESANEGNDTVEAQSYILPDNVENIVLRDRGFGVGGGYGVGNALANVIDGRLVSGAWLDGGGGADVLIGSGYDDTYVVDTPDDVIIELSESRSIDTVQASFSYSIAGNTLFENITLTGTANTTATGNELNNRLDGSLSSGTNNLSGGLGDDTYVIGAGDVVVEALSQGTDTIIFNHSPDTTHSIAGYQNIEQFMLGYEARYSNLSGDAGSNYLIGNQFSNIINGGGGDDVIIGSRVDRSNPFDTLVDIDQLHGGDGNDDIAGGRNAEITGGRGNDILRGGKMYRYSLGDGKDTIVGTGYTGTAQLIFDSTVSAQSVTLSRNGRSLIIIVGVSGTDTITIENAWSADGALTLPIGSIVFQNASGTALETWNSAAILGRALAVTLTGGAGDDQLISGAGFDTLTGNAGNDYLEGGAGNDSLDGGAGNDSYFFDTGFGHDQILNLNNATSGLDIIRFSGQFTVPGLIRTVGDNGDLTLQDFNGNELVLVGYMLPGSPLHEIRFSDGIVWTRESIRTEMLAATEFSDSITGLGTDDVINALGGDDYVYGNGGNDVIHGGTGADFLNGNNGDDHLYGDDGDDQLQGGVGADVLEGGLGNDTYYVSDNQDLVIEQTAAGTDVVYSSVNYALTGNVENLVLTDAATNGTGNALNNRIEGNDLNNLIDGGAGTDTMLGGLGDDTYTVDVSTDLVTESSSSGTDTVLSSASTYTLGSNVENLTLTGSAAINGTGNTLANTIIGNAGNNSLSGGSGNDRLDGGAGDDNLNGGSGNDTMLGGMGNDTYVVDAAGDALTELANEGTDLVQSSVTYVLGNNIENLTLTGTATTATGNTLNNVLNGNNSNNTLNGGDGNDTLNGGSGTDTLIGGNGNDIYRVDTTTDLLTETATGGVDTVESSVSFNLVNISNVENLTLTGTATTATGNTLDNVLIGNSANNTLTGVIPPFLVVTKNRG